MRTRRDDETAHGRFRRRDRRRSLIALAAALVVHLLLLFGLPLPPKPRVPTPSPRLEVVTLPSRVVDAPPEIVLPEPAVPVPRPEPPAPEGPREPGRTVPPPSHTPHEIPPRLLNRREVTSLLHDLYPAGLEVLSVGDVVTLWMYVDTAGRVLRTVVRDSSRYAGLNRAAQVVARTMHFRPARQAGRPVAVWVQQAIRFRASDTDSGGPGEETDRPGST